MSTTPTGPQRFEAFVAALEAHARDCHFCPAGEVSCHFCGEVKEIHPESIAQFGEPTCIQCFNTTMRRDPTNDVYQVKGGK